MVECFNSRKQVELADTLRKSSLACRQIGARSSPESTRLVAIFPVTLISGWKIRPGSALGE